MSLGKPMSERKKKDTAYVLENSINGGKVTGIVETETGTEFAVKVEYLRTIEIPDK